MKHLVIAHAIVSPDGDYIILPGAATQKQQNYTVAPDLLEDLAYHGDIPFGAQLVQMESYVEVPRKTIVQADHQVVKAFVNE